MTKVCFAGRQRRRALISLVLCIPALFAYYLWHQTLIQTKPKLLRGAGRLSRGSVFEVIDARLSDPLSSADDRSCVQPHLDLWHPNLTPYFTDPKPLECDKVERDWVLVKNGTFLISDEAIQKHGSIKCQYIPLVRGDSDDDTVVKGAVISPMLHGSSLNSDFFSTHCTAEDGATYHNIHSGIAYSEKLHKRRKVLADNAMGVDIIMFGLDSTSRMTWMRNLPRTHDFVVDQLGGIMMEGYNIVGDGTPQALLPILTGQTELELPEARRDFQDAKPVDDHPWIWRDLMKHGYVTQWGEDGASFGTFNFRMLGFKHQPVDHYMRPFYLTIEKLYHQHKHMCLGSIPRHLNMLNWIRQFVFMYPSQPKFSFLFHSEYSHGGFSESRLADQDIKDLLWDLNESGVLDNAVLILMADHGARFQAVRRTEQGKYEERLPYLVIRVPPMFTSKYPELVKNLKINAHRLTTPFDLHATFRDILSYSGPGLGNVSDRSISLFKEVPQDRTCAHADIAPHWCTCLKWVKVQVDEDIVQEAGLQLVQGINSFTQAERNKCQELFLHNVTSAVSYSANEKMLMFKQSQDIHGRIPNLSDDMKALEILYQISIITRPGMGQFEATLTYVVNEHKFRMSEKQISRVNKYGSQPACVMKRLPHLRPYCYCKTQRSK